MLAPPPGVLKLPEFDRGWLAAGGGTVPYLSYTDADPSVNWSPELEALHEESSRTHFLDRWTRGAIVDRLGPLGTGPVIADIGCSTGFLLEDLRRAYPDAELIGVDLISAGLVKAHRTLPDARLLRADACALPLSDASVDAVVSANLLEHIQDDVRAVSEMARVLRPGGRVVLVVPAGAGTYDYYDRFLGHERRYERGELASKCLLAGLDVIDDVYIAALIYPAFWVVKQYHRVRYRNLVGKPLETKVAADIGRTRDSRLGLLAWRLEDRVLAAGFRLPFGIRSLVSAQLPF